MRCLLLFALTVLVCPAPLFGQSRVSSPPVRTCASMASVPRVDTAVTLDGQALEGGWDRACRLPMTMLTPVLGGPLTEPTTLRLLHDGTALYVFADLNDSQPGRVRANSLYRDRYGGGDRVGIVLDTFDDDTSGLFFWTTPAGIRGDAAITNDGVSTGVDAVNDDWNAHWSVATRHTSSGWTAEFRIPLGSLGFQSDDGAARMGVIAFRQIARKNEIQTFPRLDPGRDVLSPSLAETIRLDTVRADRPVYVTPYLLGRTARDESGSASATSHAWDAGVDLRYDLSSTLTLDATVNTDFAQVEADDLRVNLSRFSLFFPEKRQFFQEGAGLFAFPTAGFGSDRLFYSRRIGLSDGRPVPILGGAKLVGRIGAWDVGGMNLQTGRQTVAPSEPNTPQTTPSENFGVLRLRRSVFNPRSYAGLLVTSRLSGDGSRNVAYGVDADVRFAEDDYLTLRAAQTVDDAVQEGRPGWTTALLQMQLERRRRRGYNYWLNVTQTGADFRPDVGFSQRTGVTEIGAWNSYDWILGSDTSLRLLSPLQIFGYVYLRNDDGTVESALVEWDTDTEWESGARFSTDLEWHLEDLTGPLELPGATVLDAGTYRFWATSASLETPSGRAFEGEVGAGASTFFGGRRADLEVEGGWNASPHLQLAVSYEFTRARFPTLPPPSPTGKTPGFDAHLGRLRLQTALDTHFSADVLTQWSSVDDRIAANVRLRYTAGEGRDIWLVYGERLDSGALLRPSQQRASQARTVTLKMTYTVGL